MKSGRLVSKGRSNGASVLEAMVAEDPHQTTQFMR